MAVPEGIYLEYQPAHSPELQPAECLWALAREFLANRLFETLDAIEDAIVERCRQLDAQTERIRRLVGFQWWIDAMRGRFEEPSVSTDELGITHCTDFPRLDT